MRIASLIGAVCLVLCGCAADPPPLATRPTLAGSVAELDRTRDGGVPIPAGGPLSPAELGLLALNNNPDLRAARARAGVSRAQVIEAGLLPDPVLSGSYGVLIAGPAFANAIGASLTQDITSLVTLAARKRAARQAAMAADASLVWQEWQVISRAQTLAIDLVEQDRLLASLERTLDLLRQRARLTAEATRQGLATVQGLAPDIAALTSLETQFYNARLAQDQRWQSLDALLGLAPDVRPVLDPRIAVPAIRPEAASALLASLAQRRPDLIALQLGYAAQKAGLRAAILGQFPALSLGPNFAEDTSQVQALGPTATLTLPVFNRNRGQVAIQRATAEQLHEEYTARLDAAAGAARALVHNLGLLEGSLAAARAGLGRSRMLAVDAAHEVSAGRLDELTYVELVSTRLEKERQVIGLEQQVQDSRTILATLLGSGLPPVRLTVPKGPSLL